MYNLFFSTPSLTNCTFSNNSAEYGGAIDNCESTTRMVNCTISGNSAVKMCGGIRNGFGGSSIVSNCILWGNSDSYGMDESSQIANMYSNETSVVNYCCIQGWTGSLGGIGNFGNEPLFVDPDAGDYHLKSQGWRWDSKRLRWHYDEVTSQCIDAGNSGSPLNAELLSMPEDPDNMWGINLRVNMGAYGGTAKASMPPYKWTLLGDLTNDGVVNVRDFAAQAQYWLRTEDTPPGDVNRDGIVDIADLALFMEDWLKYIKPPVVNIIKPNDGATFEMRPVEIEIEAQAWDSNGSVVKVEFFLSGWKIDEDNDGSDGWKTRWTSEFARGGYELTARATDSGGITTISPVVSIKVIPPH